MNILLTVEELAKYLKIKPDTIYKKVRRGELPAIKLGKLVRFPKEAIDQWISDQAARTVKDVKAATKIMEARVEEAVEEVRKTAKVASQVVPEVLDDVRKAPLDKKQEVLTRGLKTLWKGLSNGKSLAPRARAAQKPAARKTSRKPRSVKATASPRASA